MTDMAVPSWAWKAIM